jgi:hypothetical protein
MSSSESSDGDDDRYDSMCASCLQSFDGEQQDRCECCNRSKHARCVVLRAAVDPEHAWLEEFEDTPCLCRSSIAGLRLRDWGTAYSSKRLRGLSKLSAQDEVELLVRWGERLDDDDHSLILAKAPMNWGTSPPERAAALVREFLPQLYQVGLPFQPKSPFLLNFLLPLVETNASSINGICKLALACTVLNWWRSSVQADNTCSEILDRRGLKYFSSSGTPPLAALQPAAAAAAAAAAVLPAPATAAAAAGLAALSAAPALSLRRPLATPPTQKLCML